MLQARRTDQIDVFFLFKWQQFCLWEQDSGYSFASAPAPCTKTTLLELRDSGDGQRLWDYGTTEQSFNAVSAVCIAVERQGSTLTRTVCKIGSSRQRKAANLHVLIRGQCWIIKRRQSCAFSHRWAHLGLCLKGGGGGGRGRRIWHGSPQWNTKAQLPKPQTATVATTQWPK